MTESPTTPPLKLWSGTPDGLSRDYSADINQPWRPEDGLRIIPRALEADGFREIIELEEGFSVVIGDLTYRKDSEVQRRSQLSLNFHFRLSGVGAIGLEGGEPFPVERQTLVMLLSPEGIEKSEKFFDGEHEQSVTISCEPDFIRRKFRNAGGKLPQSLKAVIEGGANVPAFASTKLSAQMALAVRSLLENTFERSMRRVHAEAKALELLVLALATLSDSERRAKQSGSKVGARDIAQVERVRDLLDAAFLEPPSMEVLSREAGVNEAKLMHIFKQHTGETIFNYTQRLRMEHAKTLLETTDISVTEIAFDVGYEYSSNFTTAFRRHFGITPRAARDAIQG